jgi:hypothetical protein
MTSIYEGESLLPEINEIILDNLLQLEIKNIDITRLNYSDVLDLLNTHHNKKGIRKFLIDNLEDIIFHNNHSYVLDDVRISKTLSIYNTKIIIKFILNNKDKFKTNDDPFFLDNKHSTIYFTINLINNDEIGIAKKVFDVVNKFYHSTWNYNYDLIYFVIGNDINILKTTINFMGEDEFIKNYSLIVDNNSNIKSYIKKFLIDLVELKKYELIIKIIQIYIDKDYQHKGEKINKLLGYIKKDILLKNNYNIIEEIDFINNIISK